MAVTRTQVKTAGTTPAFPIGEGDITFRYTRPTPDYYDGMARALKDVDKDALTVAKTIAEQLMPLVTGWDYTDDDGKELAITVENLLTLPAAILTQCSQFIMDQENLDTKNAPTPSATSS